MDRLRISIRTRNLPWRIWSCEANRFKVNDARQSNRLTRSRRFATVSRVVEEKETFDVRCGSSGNITVDIYNSEALSDPNTPLIIYFPPTGVHDTDNHPPIPKYLSGLSIPTALAQVNYRWNIPPLEKASNGSGNISSPLISLSSSPGYDNHPFPTPLHDTLFAYDFLTTSFLPSFSSSTCTKPTQRPLLLAGTFLGGTLATSLALTSTYSSLRQPHKIVGLITQNAVFDWSTVASTQPQSQDPDQDSLVMENAADGGWTSKTLHSLKKRLFAMPSSAFDTFASPFLFFRTAGFMVGKKWVGDPLPIQSDEVNRYSTSIEEDNGGEVSGLDGDVISSSSSTYSTSASAVEIKGEGKKEKKVEDLGPDIARVAYLKFPPTASPTTSTSFSRYRNANPQAEKLQLVIPRSLFLYSTTITEQPNPDVQVEKKKKVKKVKVKVKVLEGETSEEQAKEMARVMRRSVLLVEFKDRAVWDEGFDASGEAGKRARVLDVDGGDGAVIGRVEEWIEDGLE